MCIFYKIGAEKNRENYLEVSRNMWHQIIGKQGDYFIYKEKEHGPAAKS
jgi:hypothetical protein